jgi:hypothetical protein
MTLLELLDHTYLAGGYTTRSDFARDNAELIARASFEGLLTTWMPSENEYGNVWRVTPFGLEYLWTQAISINQTLEEANASTTH